LGLVALLQFMRPSLRKGAYAALSSAAWQEIRVRSGRDDKGVRQLITNKWVTKLSDETSLDFVIPSEAEGSPVFSPFCFVFRDRQVGFSAIDVPGLEEL
jgi:hypothetical protein